jgi:hypothetical protein
VAEVKLSDQSATCADIRSIRELALVREACAFLAANPELASSLSIVMRGEPHFLMAASERMAEEYGLSATMDRVGGSLVLGIAPRESAH